MSSGGYGIWLKYIFLIGIHPHGISTHLFKTCRPLKAAFGHDYASLWKIVTTKSVEYYLTNRVME